MSFWSNYVKITSFWRNNDVIIAWCVCWAYTLWLLNLSRFQNGLKASCHCPEITFFSKTIIVLLFASDMRWYYAYIMSLRCSVVTSPQIHWNMGPHRPSKVPISVLGFYRLRKLRAVTGTFAADFQKSWIWYTLKDNCMLIISYDCKQKRLDARTIDVSGLI